MEESLSINEQQEDRIMVCFWSPVIPGGPDERASHAAAGMILSARSTLTSVIWDNHSLVVCGSKFGTSYSLQKFLSGGHPNKVNQHSSCARLALIQRAFLQQLCLQLGFCWESVGGKLIF